MYVVGCVLVYTNSFFRFSRLFYSHGTSNIHNCETSWIRTNASFLTDLQSAAFDRSATFSILKFIPQKIRYIVSRLYISLVKGNKRKKKRRTQLANKICKNSNIINTNWYFLFKSFSSSVGRAQG